MLTGNGGGSVQTRLLPVVLALVAACGGSPAGAPAPVENAATPEGAVQNFMKAVADSNISRMGRFWGSRRGPAVVTKTPADFEQRLGVTQIYLRGTPYQIVRTDPVPGDADRRVVVLDLDRTNADGTRCTRTVPVTVVQSPDHGWLVNALDLSLAGTPGRPCATPRT
jgi:hypothetical protein